ncbi:hypothetical protein GCM10023322_23820 [Rugosimonospora acidiphila]|uniref:Uncharacterized protein n=2 Tax=Rugosimonospora acidiphila TaxID=556531 RepID=A0ABP9RQH0_9ACTN
MLQFGPTKETGSRIRRSVGAPGGTRRLGGNRGVRMTEIASRTEAFSLVADGVAAGLVAPWRLYLARGCRYLSISVGERSEWDAWRIHLGCPDLTIRVYEAEGVVRRSSVAEIVQGGCRIAIELIEDVDTGDLRMLLDDEPGVTP